VRDKKKKGGSKSDGRDGSPRADPASREDVTAPEVCTWQRSGEFQGFQAHLAVGLDVHVRTGIQQLDDFGDITLLSSLLERGEAGEGVVIIDPHLSLLGACVCGLWVESVGNSVRGGALARFRELDCVAPIGEEYYKKRMFTVSSSRSDSAPINSYGDQSKKFPGTCKKLRKRRVTIGQDRRFARSPRDALNRRGCMTNAFRFTDRERPYSLLPLVHPPMSYASSPHRPP